MNTGQLPLHRQLLRRYWLLVVIAIGRYVGHIVLSRWLDEYWST